jgi:ribulose-5-phosphate 4-epimerase/fuculose-1-phosphate aldolase
MALTNLFLFLVCSTAFLVGIYSWSYSKYSKDIDRIQTITVQLEQVRKKKIDEGPKEPRSETPLHPDVFQELEDIIQSYRRE